jgi:tRNA pseudouridine55 synthase
MIHNVYKKRGETPLECIQRFAFNKKMTYLGRLDPLAEGVLLIATGDDVKKKEELLGLDKEYDFIAIFGFATDSYDVLGKVVRVEKLKEISDLDLMKVASVYEGERDQKYPAYSSKMLTKTLKAVASDSLRSQDAKHISLQEHSLPLKKIKIHKIKFLKLDTLSNKELFGRLLMDISKVNGDFRQNEILILWKELLLGKNNGHHCNFLGHFSAHVSSGTYIRSLVNDMGNTLGCGATVLSIKRTRVGDYKIEDSLKA